jgi:cysteine desulfurase
MPYLDHAATTPVLPEAVAAVTEALGELGNASSLHGSGRFSRRRIEESREQLAAVLGARPSEVIFTAGGTESDNLAVKGIYWARHDENPRRRRVIASAIEHHAVMDAVEWLAAHEGADVTWLPVDSTGRVEPAALRAELAADPDSVALVSVMWANNEVGTVQPVAELAAIAHEFGVPIHTDAVQAVGSLPVDFAASGADALSLTGHKLGGMYGSGALLLRREQACVPLLHGGGQERDVRSGTLDMPRRPPSLSSGAPRSAPACARCARNWSRASGPASLTWCRTDIPRTGCPASRTSRSPDAKGTLCSCCWTHAASSVRPDRPARPGWPVRPTS